MTNQNELHIRILELEEENAQLKISGSKAVDYVKELLVCYYNDHEILKPGRAKEIDEFLESLDKPKFEGYRETYNGHAVYIFSQNHND